MASPERKGYAPAPPTVTRFALTVRRPFQPKRVARVFDTWDEANRLRVAMNTIGRNSGATRAAWAVQQYQTVED